MTKTLNLWSTTIGDTPFNAQAAAQVGASFGGGAATGSGSNPANPLQMGDDGNLVVNISSAGVTPGATGSDRVLAILTVPAGGFDQALRGISIEAAGNAPNTNAKTVKLIVNPTNPVVGAVVSGGTLIAAATGSVAGGWNLAANIYKYGGPGSNTQICIHSAGQIGATLTALTAPTLSTFPENAPITVVVTGNVTTGANDVVYNFGEIFAMN
jgi:hypothetical protein